MRAAAKPLSSALSRAIGILAWLAAFAVHASADLPPHRFETNTPERTGAAAPTRGRLLALSENAGPAKRHAGSAAAVAVIYPEIAEPYRAVFTRIIEGIESQFQARVQAYPLTAESDLADLNAKFKREGVRVVIALGRQGVKAAAALNPEIAVVVGGVVAAPDAEKRVAAGISLIPDPALLFSRLKTLLPGVRRVVVVYDPRQNEWLIKLAREAARLQNLELVAHEARDLATAARHYEAAFPLFDNRTDSLWLPQDATTVEEKTILPLVLTESWNRSVAVFSSSFSHVRRGALFALYPNNLELGRDLANSAAGLLAGEPVKRGILPLREVQTAVNLRTAGHVGINLDARQQRNFDYVFPEP